MTILDVYSHTSGQRQEFEYHLRNKKTDTKHPQYNNHKGDYFPILECYIPLL